MNLDEAITEIRSMVWALNNEKCEDEELNALNDYLIEKTHELEKLLKEKIPLPRSEGSPLSRGNDK